MATVGVSGSLGRMEQVAQSDCDLIVILHDDVGFSGSLAEAAYAAVWEALRPLGLSRPRLQGIYATPSTKQQLCCPASLGQIDEPPGVFGKRIQLLLDCQPVYNSQAYRQLADSIVDRYALGHRESATRRDWEYLTCDLIRYFRSLNVYYRWHALDQSERWRLRNLKLRYSRLILYVGLLWLIGESSAASDGDAGWLKDRLGLTPLERVASVYNRYEDDGLLRVITGYDAFLLQLGDAAFRKSVATATQGRPDCHPKFIELLEDSRDLLRELMRFVSVRANEWDDSFFECLFF